MNQNQSSCGGFKINPAVKTAIIYSIDELFSYLIEIKHENKSYYICDKNDEPIKFGNFASARQAAINENVQEAYLALSKTYEENDLSTCHNGNHERFDYSAVALTS